jgi:MarR family transcriptional regulator, organic hydroperoxide resistance regulator
VKDQAVRRLLESYPKIFFACHVRHVRDPETRKELSAHQASILDHLDDKEPISLMTLAQHMGVTASTMSLTVDRLVRSGHVVREKDPGDARRVCLRLTPAGLRIKTMEKVLDPELVRDLLARLPAEDREAGLRGLELLASAAVQQIQSKQIKPEGSGS